MMRFFHYARLSILSLSCLCLTGCGGLTYWIPLPPSATTTKQAENEMRLGLAYLEAGDNERAKEKLLQAQQKTPRSATINSAIGHFFTRIGEWEQARLYHLKALALEPNSPRVHNNYGSFLSAIKEYETAEKHFLIAAHDTQYVGTANAYENAALCTLQAGKKEKALQYFNHALKQNPHLDKSWWHLAELHYQVGDYTQSKQCWNRYQQIVAQPSAAVLWLGIQLATHLNQQEEAQHYAMLLQTQYPDSRQYRDMIKTYPTLADTSKSAYH